jgi:hypothetical protein
VPLYAIGWEPVYAGTLVTRDNWPSSPDGRRRVIRESQEVPRRVTEGSYLPAVKKDGAWSLYFKPFRTRTVVPEGVACMADNAIFIADRKQLGEPS